MVSVVKVLGTVNPYVLRLRLVPSPLIVGTARSMSPLLLLLTIVELVANSCIIHRRTHNCLESVIMPGDFQIVGDDALNSIIVSHNLNLVDHSVLGCPRT